MRTHMNPVIVAGAGPTGLMLASELALAGVPVKVVEKQAEEPNLTRAFGVSARTLELLDARGMAEPVLAKGFKVPGANVSIGASIDLTRISSRFNYALIVPQSGTEKVLEQRCRDLGVPIERGATLVGIDQDDAGVDVVIEREDGRRTERASYVVGCDGAHSAVREQLGVAFVGERYEALLTLADVRLARPPAETIYLAAGAAAALLLVPFGDGYHRAVAWRPKSQATRDDPLTLDEVREILVATAGSDFGLLDARWMTRFQTERKQAEHYRVGRVVLAGDAAHVHSPAGAQGMNTGIGDAMNLGWKLASTAKGEAPGWLLDTYESERHPVGSQVLQMTDGLNKIVGIRSPLAIKAVGLGLRAATGFGPVQNFMGAFLSGVGISYAPRGRHPHHLAGHRAMDVNLNGARLYEALRAGRFVVVDTTASASLTGSIRAAWGDRVVVLSGTPGPDAPGALPAVMLVRPDSYVAWASDRADVDKILGALADWSGEAEAAAS